MANPRNIRFLMVLAILNSALFAIFSYTRAFSVYLHLSTIPLSVLIIVIIEKLGSFFWGAPSYPVGPQAFRTLEISLQPIWRR